MYSCCCLTGLGLWSYNFGLVSITVDFSKLAVTRGPSCSDAEEFIGKFAEGVAAKEEVEICRNSREEIASAAECVRTATD